MGTRMNIIDPDKLKEVILVSHIIEKLVNNYIHWCQPTTNVQIVNSCRTIFNINLNPYNNDKANIDPLKMDWYLSG